MEKLRIEMHEVIDEYGLNSVEALKKSQELDLFVAAEMRRINRGNSNGRKEVTTPQS